MLAARKEMKNLDLLLTGPGSLMSKEMEKDKVLNVTLFSVFFSRIGLQAPENRGKVWSEKDLPSVEEFSDGMNWEKCLMHQMVALRCCAVFTLGDIQEPSGHALGNLLSVILLSRGVGLNDLRRSLPTSTILCFFFRNSTIEDRS
ncbi:hypothetical protein WISP_116771 [Willisornis vidua]|uniref:Uncharacterized protein n=1 Tax=Willisornis vidua TaxID=1566151 RepID=A0ABQ9CYT5_9PASS|nr:hypothetical protein WISP_116771 [Willisornis vidua]